MYKNDGCGQIEEKVRVCVTASKMTLNLKCLRHPVARLLTRSDDQGTLYVPLRATANAGLQSCNEKYL